VLGRERGGEGMINEVKARLVYCVGVEVWTRGVEHFYDMKELDDYVTRNEERILCVTITRN
jgi:hypothetical protein